jgi:hypothetical protein
MSAVEAEIEDVEFQLPSKTAALTLGFCVVASAALTYETFAGHGPFVAATAAMALFFAYGAIRTSLRLIAGKPWTVLMGDGMTFAFSRTVTWDEVKSVTIVRGLSGAAWKGFISVELHDPEAFLERLTWQQRRNARISMSKGHGPIRLPGDAFPVPLEDVVATMRQFHPDLDVRA